MDTLNIFFHVMAALISLASFITAVWAARAAQNARDKADLKELQSTVQEIDKRLLLIETKFAEHMKIDEELHTLMKNHIFNYEEFLDMSNKEKEFAVLQNKIENDEQKAAEMYSLFIDFMRTVSLGNMKIANFNKEPTPDPGPMKDWAHREPKDPSKW